LKILSCAYFGGVNSTVGENLSIGQGTTFLLIRDFWYAIFITRYVRTQTDPFSILYQPYYSTHITLLHLSGIATCFYCIVLLCHSLHFDCIIVRFVLLHYATCI